MIKRLTILLALILTIPFFSLANNQCDYVCQLKKLCTGENAKQFKIIDQKRCDKFREYYMDLVSTTKKYSTNTLKLTPYILAGLIDRETLWTYALKPDNCEGFGDADFGHGLVQIHGAFSQPKLGKLAKPGTKVTKSTRKYGNEQFAWWSCSDSIKYLGAYFLNIEENYKNSILEKMRNANTDLSTNAKGEFVDYKSQYIYMQLILNSYNAGGYGALVKNNCYVNKNQIVDDGCTTGKDYGLDIINRAKDFYQADVTMQPWQGELFRISW